MDVLLIPVTPPSWWTLRVRKYSTFDVFREVYLHLLKKKIFLSILRVPHVVFTQNKHGKNVERAFFWQFVLGTQTFQTVPKKHLDAAM